MLTTACITTESVAAKLHLSPRRPTACEPRPGGLVPPPIRAEDIPRQCITTESVAAKLHLSLRRPATCGRGPSPGPHTSRGYPKAMYHHRVCRSKAASEPEAACGLRTATCGRDFSPGPLNTSARRLSSRAAAGIRWRRVCFYPSGN